MAHLAAAAHWTDIRGTLLAWLVWGVYAVAMGAVMWRIGVTVASIRDGNDPDAPQKLLWPFIAAIIASACMLIAQRVVIIS